METSDASKTALLLVEKKVRNLEKRKLKLDGYKKMVDCGQELNEDQKKAIANLSSVEMSLEMTKDLHKQFQQLHSETQKQLKKQARRDQVASQAAQHNCDVAKVKQVLELQSLMDNLSEDVRSDFLNGTNGAVLVKEEEFTHIDNFYKLITPDSELETDMSKQINMASEHIINLLEGCQDQVAGTTYKVLFDLVERIKKSGYFSPNKSSPQAENEGDDVEEEEDDESSGMSSPNGELSGSGEDITSEQPQPQEPAPAQSVAEPVQPLPTNNQEDSLTANEHGLNFLGDSEVEKSGIESVEPASTSDWSEQVENGHHGNEFEANEMEQPPSNGFVQRGRGSRGFRGNFRGRGGGGDRGQRRGGRGGFGSQRGGFDDGQRRGNNRGGRGGFSRGGPPRGVRRGAPQ